MAITWPCRFEPGPRHQLSPIFDAKGEMKVGRQPPVFTQTPAVSSFLRALHGVKKNMPSEIVPKTHLHSPVDLAKLKSGQEKRGFSSMEKWMIWAVFCLLVGLSTRFIIFPALLLISWGVVRFRWYMNEKTTWPQRWPAVVVFFTGAGIVLWSIFY